MWTIVCYIKVCLTLSSVVVLKDVQEHLHCILHEHKQHVRAILKEVQTHVDDVKNITPQVDAVLPLLVAYFGETLSDIIRVYGIDGNRERIGQDRSQPMTPFVAVIGNSKLFQWFVLRRC
ncbi:uncharacterized protein LOC141915320 [Tubulanus polymorphus]|uniref:uncharacterized protein LOC141915320 n=1 Tax=Tubulanus polymorphus TaxID=672921 RepID=UPI003DA4E841